MNIGDRLPEILGSDEQGRLLRLSQFAGQGPVLYFYPKDNTSGCTAEACSLRDHYDELRQLGYAVVGVSTQDAASHRRFIEKNRLPFPLIADVDKALVQATGVWGEKKMAGRSYMGTIRTTFVADGQGIITHKLEARQVNTAAHARQLLELLR